MQKGGYVILDFKDINLSTEGATTVTGVYSQIEGSYRKAILVSGITIDNVEYRDTFVDCVTSGSNYTFTACGKTFTITSTDSVTLA